jgi:CheY-like chemotaxis protein
MPAEHPRTKSSRRSASDGGQTRLPGSATRAGGTLTEVVTTEAAVKRALAPLAREGSARGIELTCEIASAVGRYVLGGRRQLTEIVARAAAEGLAASGGGAVNVRLARQHAGFAPTDTVLVSVSIHTGAVSKDVACLEACLQPAEDDDSDEATFFAGKRVLVVVSSAHGGRVHTSTVKRFGATVRYAPDGPSATQLLRDARGQLAPFDVVFIDEAVVGAEALLVAARDDVSLGAPHRVVASALADASCWLARGGESLLSKPVLPLELCDVLVAGRTVELEGSPETVTRTPPSGERRASGMRSLDLAALLAAVAVAPGSGRR